MKKSKRLGHKIGVILIFLLLGFLFITESIRAKDIEPVLTFVVAVLFVFSGYWRLYQFYKLEKIWKVHNKKDFIDYFDNMSFGKSIIHIVPFPILKPFKSDKENNIRFQINMSTAVNWVTFILFLIII